MKLMVEATVQIEMTGDDARALRKLLGQLSSADHVRAGLDASESHRVSEIFGVLASSPNGKRYLSGD